MFVISNEITHRLGLLDRRTRKRIESYLLEWISVNGDLQAQKPYLEMLRERKLSELFSGHRNLDSDIGNYPIVVEIIGIWKDEIVYRKSLEADLRRSRMKGMDDDEFFGQLC